MTNTPKDKPAAQSRSLLSRITFGLLGAGQRAAPRGSGQRAFHAARLDRLSADWLATTASINQELRGDLDRLRARGRDLKKNNDYARKFVGLCEDNIVGPNGVRLQSRVMDAPGRFDESANAAIETAYHEWMPVADVTGRQHFVDMCKTLVGGLPSDGEFLVREVMGPDAGNRFNYALQIIDVDRIDTTFNGTAVETGNTVVMGVEMNTYRRPVALHVFSAHPGDVTARGRKRERLPMEQLIHGFKVDHAEQVRGIPWMAPGMLSLHHLAGFMLSAVLAAEHGANHYGFFKTPDGAPPIGNEDAAGQQITTSQPGTYDTLPSGVEFQAHESKYPSETFAPFVKTALQRVATGWRVAYVSLANDLEGVSYSSIRQGVLEERDRWMGDQQWFVASLMERVQANWLRMSLLSGAITFPNGTPLPAAKYAKFSGHEFQPRRWEWVDPQGDMTAKVMAVTAGLNSPQNLAAEMGRDFGDVMTDIAAAQKMAKEKGVALTAYDGKPGANSAAAAAPATAASV